MKNYKTLSCYLLMFLFTNLYSVVYGQNFDRLNIPYFKGDKELKLPFTGGIKGAQFSNIDFNGDGIDDLFVFDRNGDVIIPLVKTGLQGSLDFVFAPEYIPVFPKLKNWALLVDYNNDGIKDIFTSSSFYPACIEVWKGSKDQSGRLSFKMLTFAVGLPEILTFPISSGYTQIYVSSIDLPAIADVDFDGDMDIISFEPDGSFASYYQNMSKEENLGADSLKYVRKDICWGRFAENQFSEAITLSADGFSCAAGFSGGGNTGVRHSGSTLCVLDIDGDTDMDVLIGDLASTRIKLLVNGGSKDNAHMTSQDDHFPTYDLPINIDVFLASFYVDVDGDGDRDLIATPNEAYNSESTEHVWLYRNIGTDKSPIFKFEKNNFLIDEMAYFNSASHPAFADINGDGLLDLVVGSNGILNKSGVKQNRMYMLSNVGTNENPAYKEVDLDYLEFSKYDEFTGRFAPTFGDLDGDDDLDLLIGDVRGYMYYLENTGGENNPMEFKQPVYKYFDIFVGQNAKPFIIDLDFDGLNDIVIGEKNNQLNYLKNIGSKNAPMFNSSPSTLPNTDKLGNIYATGNDFDTQYGAPVFINQDSKLNMILGIDNGSFIHYNHIEGNIYKNFDLVTKNFGSIHQGRRVSTSFADIDNDGYYEMAVGNERGGLVFYNTIFKVDSTSGTSNIVDGSLLNFNVYPNPTTTLFRIESSVTDAKFSLLDIYGNSIMSLFGSESIDCSSLSSGSYIIKMESKGNFKYKKLIVL